MAVERVGVSFEPMLLKNFDALIQKKGYPNRSEAIRDLVRRSIAEEKIKSRKGNVVGTITIVYEHHSHNVASQLLHLQHLHNSEIYSTTHVHIDKHACLEVLVVHGDYKKVKKLADNIKAMKGVKYGELVITKGNILKETKK